MGLIFISKRKHYKLVAEALRTWRLEADKARCEADEKIAELDKLMARLVYAKFISPFDYRDSQYYVNIKIRLSKQLAKEWINHPGLGHYVSKEIMKSLRSDVLKGDYRPDYRDVEEYGEDVARARNYLHRERPV